jgi:DNA-binding CsgD family transcriptional regulator
MADFLSPTNARLLRLLIQGPDLWESQRQIADAADLTPPQVNVVLHHLQFQRLAKIRSEGVLIDRHALQEFFVNLRRTRLAPVAEVRAEKTAAELQADGGRAVLGLFTAANLHAPFENRNAIDVIVPPGTGRGFAAGVRQAEGTVTVRVFEDSLKSLETARRPEGVLTSPLQTILDLKAVPEGSRFARFLASNAGLRGSLWP